MGLFSLVFSIAIAAPIPPTVFVDSIKKSEIFDTLSFPARIIPQINAAILSDLDGVVEKVVVPIGRPVKKGDTLILIKNTDPVYDYAPAKMTSPVSGVVSSLEVSEGSRVARGQKLASVTDPAKTKINIEVTPQDLSLLKRNLEGQLKFSQFDEAVPVKVSGISPFVDPSSGTATVELVTINTSRSFISPGMVGRVSFRTGKHLGIQVPEFSIVYRGAGTFIASLSPEKKVKLVPVKIGPIRKGFVEVLEGISDSSQYIVRSSAFLSDGEGVTVQKKEELGR